MKIKHTIKIFLFFSAWSLHGQNLVPNGDFETMNCCPSCTVSTGCLSCASSWFRTQCTPDYFNPCDTFAGYSVPSNSMGNQTAHSGFGYAGFFTFNKFLPNSNREYIENMLSTPLQNNHKYLVSFYVSLSDNSQFATNLVGAYLSPTPISGSNCNLLSYAPQIQNTSSNPLTDTSGWTLVSDTLHPLGGEQYISIGNFMSDSACDTTKVGISGQYSYYYIDDVSLIDLGPTGIENHLREKPNVFPIPADELLWIESSSTKFEVSISDVYGNLLSRENKDGEFSLNTAAFPNGIYFLAFRDNENTFLRKIAVQH